MVQQTTVTYTAEGKDTAIAPTNMGTYPVKIIFTARPGATQVDPVTTSLTIMKISQNAPSAPKASNTGTNSLTITAIPGAEFSIDGGTTWQASTIFNGLTPDTAYTIQAKYPGDQNHYESPVSSSIIRTTRQNASFAAVQSSTGISGTAYELQRPRPIPALTASKSAITMRSGHEMVETPCYKELEGPSTMQAMEKTLVTLEKFAD